MRRLLAVLLLAGCVVGGVFADPVQPGFFYDQNAQASYDPLGLQLVSQVYYRIPLFRMPGILWESTRIDVGIQNNLSPSYEMIGPAITIEPIAFLDLTFTAQLIGYYSELSFGFYTLPDYSAGYDSPSLAPLTPKDTTGYLLTASPTLKFALGPVAALDKFQVSYFNVDGGSGFFYERINNTVLGKSDTELVNQAYLLYTVAPGTRVGLNDALLYVPSSGYVSHRLSAMGVYSGNLSDALTLYGALFLGTFLADRYYQWSVYVAGQVGITLKL